MCRNSLNRSNWRFLDSGREKIVIFRIFWTEKNSVIVLPFEPVMRYFKIKNYYRTEFHSGHNEPNKDVFRLRKGAKLSDFWPAVFVKKSPNFAYRYTG